MKREVRNSRDRDEIDHKYSKTKPGAKRAYQRIGIVGGWRADGCGARLFENRLERRLSTDLILVDSICRFFLHESYTN